MATLSKVQIRPKKYGRSSSGSTVPNIIRASVGTHMGTPLAASSGGGWVGFGQPGLFATTITGCTQVTVTTPGAAALDPPIIYTFCNATQPYGRDFLNLNLKMIRANDYSFNIQVVLNGNALNCLGGILRMTAKWLATDTDGNEVFSVFSPSNGIAWINQSQGTATITIASGLTNTNAIPFNRIDLPYDIEFTDTNGKRFTVAYGTLTILPNISQTSP